MNINDIPVRVIGPGSQPVLEDEQRPSCIDMPDDMSTFARPSVPEPGEFGQYPAARETMVWLRQALRSYEAGAESKLANLDALDAKSRDLVNQILGEGEVSITSKGTAPAKTQESILAGIWRTVYLDEAGNVCHDILEVAEAPHVFRAMPVSGPVIDINEDRDRSDISNALALLVELHARCDHFEAEGTPHSINLSLLPLADIELEYLDARLGRGPIEVLSRAYGKCQVISTGLANVWWVRYYNSMGTLILNSLEIIDIPQVVKAAPEDLRDSAERLDEILEPYWSDES